MPPGNLHAIPMTATGVTTVLSTVVHLPCQFLPASHPCSVPVSGFEFAAATAGNRSHFPSALGNIAASRAISHPCVDANHLSLALSERSWLAPHARKNRAYVQKFCRSGLADNDVAAHRGKVVPQLPSALGALRLARAHVGS